MRPISQRLAPFDEPAYLSRHLLLLPLSCFQSMLLPIQNLLEYARRRMRTVTTIPKDKFRNFAQRLVKELSSHYSKNKIDLVKHLNRQLAGWANFYQFTDYTAVWYGKLDRILFWKLAHWLARKYRTSIKPLIKQGVRKSSEDKAKTWTLFGRSGKGHLCGITLRRLVTSRKGSFRWRNPEVNPYLPREEKRNTVTSRYQDVAMAMGQT